MWGYRDIDSRGERILQFLLANNLLIANSTDAPPTFERGIFKGCPDLTISTQDIISKKFLNKLKPSINPLLEEIRNSQTQDDINKTTSHFQNKIINACKSTYKTKKQEVARPPSWYTSKLEIEKIRLKALKRRAQRAPKDKRSRRFLTLKKDQALYMKHVKQAKNSGWKTFCTNASNPYSKQYKAAFRKTISPSHLIALKNNNPTGDQLKIADNILEQMFPKPLNYADLPTRRTNTPDDVPFTKDEIAIVIKNLHKGKAPGPDGIDSIIIQQIYKRFPILFMELFNKCLHLGTFPEISEGPAVRNRRMGCPHGSCSGPVLWNLVANKILQETCPENTALQQEARVKDIRRLNISLPDTLTTLIPGEVEKGETSWAAYPAEYPSKEQISLLDGGGITSGTRFYIDGSKTEKGVGAAFCVLSGQTIAYRWLAKLQDYNSVFQAEHLALKHATDHAISLPHQPITILMDNQASVQAAANPRSRNTTAKEICKSLITNKHVHISWIKVHMGYDGNEEAD
ncbi:hypothetical protein AVEN_95431-1 [Araneus ventricosus]|uniref:RNase H type-1 domain-containing protein n=1 Tax=Araneus ventricosus TaxID=182803 RepID=A0A4Y2CI25_ARAVE|nr:hypothetical protein AVEN_95431-1 [Araneus ventricosus]